MTNDDVLKLIAENDNLRTQLATVTKECELFKKRDVLAQMYVDLVAHSKVADAKLEDAVETLNSIQSKGWIIGWSVAAKEAGDTLSRIGPLPSSGVIHPNECVCGHPREAHIYYEGACRPGWVCDAKCEQFHAARSGTAPPDKASYDCRVKLDCLLQDLHPILRHLRATNPLSALPLTQALAKAQQDSPTGEKPATPKLADPEHIAKAIIDGSLGKRCAWLEYPNLHDAIADAICRERKTAQTEKDNKPERAGFKETGGLNCPCHDENCPEHPGDDSHGS